MKNIVILGHGVGVKFVVESLIKSNSNFRVVALVTHPKKEHEHDLNLMNKRKELFGEFAYNVFNVESDYNVKVLESKNVNHLETINWIKTFSPTYIVSISCRDILKSKFLNEFKNMVLNIHTTPLPQYRGAANDSWMILNNELGKKKYGCLHFIDEGIDTGPIIQKSFYNLPKIGYPIDIFKSRMNIFHEILVKGLKKLEKKDFKPETQENSISTTFPRLYTPIDGKIKFDLFSGKEIELFVYAFGYPYDGAHVFFEETKINILKSKFFTEYNFHSYANGLIFGKNNSGEYKVSVTGGYLLIEEIEINGKKHKQGQIFKLGKYLK